MKILDISAECDANLCLTAEATDKEQITFIVEGRSPDSSRPVLNLSWSVPLVDIQCEWYPTCGTHRSLHVDWHKPICSGISSSAPVFCFMNAKGENRITIALSEVLSKVSFKIGVHEEDGRLYFNIAVPIRMDQSSCKYQCTLYRIDDSVSMAEALRRVSLWWEKCAGLKPMHVPDAAKEPMYSFWYSYHQATYADDIEKECLLASQEGFRTVIVDDGWQTSDGNRGYAYCGDWKPSPEKIPDMIAHVRKVHQMGLRYVLWYSVPFVGFHSKHWNCFQDKLLETNQRRGAGTLDPRFPEVRNFLINVYKKALTEWDLDGFKLDFIDCFSVEQVPPFREGMDEENVEAAVYRLMTDISEVLQAIKPDILIEFRQTYIGPAMRTYGNMFRVGDCPDDFLSNRIGTVDLRLLSGNTAVHSDMLMWHPDDTMESVALQFIGVIFSTVQVSVRLDELSDVHRRGLRFWLDFIRENRDVLQSPLEVTDPQNLYTQVSASKNGKTIIALYACHQVVSLDTASNELIILNGTEDEETILKTVPQINCTVTYRNCDGTHVGSASLEGNSLYALHIRAGGMAIIQKLQK